MRQHARAARTMRAAVIGGQLEEARRAASQIASDEWTPRLQLEHSLYVSAVRSAAQAVQASTSLADAAEGLGEVGATCAACHRNVGAPSRSWAVATSEVGNVRMAAHARAEQALWDGLVNSSDASWSSGARELLEAPELDSDDDEMSLLARRARDQAREAASATGTRGDVYGRIVATCSSCHRLNARTP
jgi:mono/diheme cytochrome c family protein